MARRDTARWMPLSVSTLALAVAVSPYCTAYLAMGLFQDLNDVVSRDLEHPQLAVPGWLRRRERVHGHNACQEHGGARGQQRCRVYGDALCQGHRSRR